MSENQYLKKSPEYLPLCEASKKSGYTPEYLNSLARKGKLKAQKIGRNWYTTEVWLDEFVSETKAVKKEAVREKVSVLDSTAHEYCLNGKIGEKEFTEISHSEFNAEAEVEEPGCVQTFSAEEADDKSPGEIIQAAAEYRVKKEKAFQETEIKFEARWKLANIFAASLVAIFLAIGILQIGRLIKYSDSKNLSADDFENGIYPKWISASEGIVMGEETAADVSGTVKGAESSSENFQIREIKFGGAIALASAPENKNLEINDVRSEVMQTKGKEENRLLIRWSTNKPAVSTLEYSKMNGNNPKKLTEDGYGFSHSVILAGLDPGTAYTYVITDRDKWANEVSSDRYSAYTGTKTVSVFDLIVNAVKEVFGWAVKS